VKDTAFLVILGAALLVRLQLATTAPYIHDEENTAIPLSRVISLSPGHINLPLRAENHGALPAYVVKASSAIFGTTRLGYRALHVAIGLGAIVLVFLLTKEWYGPVAARWAAALMAFNEYYLAISSRATAHAPHLFLVAAAIFSFARFLRVQRAGYLYAAGGFLGLAFYCKEHSALLLPVFLVTLCQASYRRWLLGPHVYLAALVFAALIAPDVYWNLTTDRETARIPYRTEEIGYATYQSHLERIGGLGFSPYPSMFYARDAVRSLHLRVAGTTLRDETPEYRSMNPAIGLLLVGSVVAITVRRHGPDQVRVFLLLMFWGLFVFFSSITRGDPPGRLDPVSWIWVEVTILPAVILAGAWLAGATGAWRIVAWTFAGATVIYAVVNLLAPG